MVRAASYRRRKEARRPTLYDCDYRMKKQRIPFLLAIMCVLALMYIIPFGFRYHHHHHAQNSISHIKDTTSNIDTDEGVKGDGTVSISNEDEMMKSTTGNVDTDAVVDTYATVSSITEDEMVENTTGNESVESDGISIITENEMMKGTTGIVDTVEGVDGNGTVSSTSEDDEWMDGCPKIDCPRWRQAYEGVLLVMFVKYLPNLRHLEYFKNIYSPFEIAFYADATDCEPRYDPCVGPAVNQSDWPSEVRWVPELGGGWYMQKVLLHAIEVSAGRHTGYLLLADDATLRFPDLMESPLSSVWAAPLEEAFNLDEIESSGYKKGRSIGKYGRLRSFYNATDDDFRERIRHNIGLSDSEAVVRSDVFATSANYDFLYIPKRFAQQWSLLCRQMTDFGLVFTNCFCTGWVGAVDTEPKYLVWRRPGSRESTSEAGMQGDKGESDVFFVETLYAGQHSKPSTYLPQLSLNGTSMDLIHPFKLSDPQRRSALCNYLQAAAARDCPEGIN